ALLVREESSEATMAFVPEEADEEGQRELEDFGIKGPALVVRSGGGRAGETFALSAEKTTIGRSPDCDIFLDDVTVSRRHAVVTPQRTQGGYRLFSDDDVDRLETILRLQRDEFLPLRVIRQELSSPLAKERRRRQANGLAGGESELDLGELCDRAGIDAQLA